MDYLNEDPYWFSEGLIEQVLSDRAIVPDGALSDLVEVGLAALSDLQIPLASARAVAFDIRRALEHQRPLSLIRMGDGEALVMARGKIMDDAAIRSRAPFLDHSAMMSDPRLPEELLWAWQKADWVGVPISRRPNFQPLLWRVLDAAGKRGHRDRLTNSLVNYQLWERGLLGHLLKRRRVAVIGNRSQELAQCLANQGIEITASLSPLTNREELRRVQEICCRMKFDVAWVSAGVWAAPLCLWLSRNLGVVALDLGHVADDLLAGLPLFCHVPEPGPLSLSARDAVGAELGAVPSADADWEVEAVQPRVFRYSAYFARANQIQSRSFIVKTGTAERLLQEARWLKRVRAETRLEVPDVIQVSPQGLILTDIGGVPLRERGWWAWKLAVRELAHFHRADLPGDASTPQVATWPVLSTRLRFTLQQVAVSQANLSISDRGTLGLLMRAFERWSGAKIALGWTGMVHGDVQGNNLLVGSGWPPTITWVDWEDAGRGLWLFDLANLTHLCDIPVRNRLLREYWRAVGGKPGQLQGFVHDINQMLWERWMEKLAWILLQRAEFGGQDLDCIDFQRLREALDLGMQHPVRAADILAERN